MEYPPTEMTPEKDTSEKASIKVLRLFFVFPLDMVTIDPFPFSPRMSGQGDIEFTFGPTTPGGPPGTLCTILRSPHERSRRSHRYSQPRRTSAPATPRSRSGTSPRPTAPTPRRSSGRRRVRRQGRTGGAPLPKPGDYSAERGRRSPTDRQPSRGNGRFAAPP